MTVVYSEYFPLPSAPGVEGRSLIDLTSTSVADLFASATDYNGTTTYSKGTMVYNQNSIWVYVNATPTSGNAPPTLPTVSNTYWELVAATNTNTFTWIAYANSVDGVTFTDFTTGDSGTGGISRSWIGIAVNKTTAVESTNSADYSWTRFVGANGTNGTNGTNGLAAYLTNEASQLFAYADGSVVSYSGATGFFKVFSGTTDVSSNFVLTTQSNPQALTVSYSGQQYTITGGFDPSEDTASIIIRGTGSGTFAGIIIDKVFSLSKSKGGYEIVSALPSTNLFEGRIVYLTTDDKLYRYTGTSWTAATAAADISGEIQYQQIGNGAVRVQHLLVTPNNLNPDPQFRDLALWTQDNESGTVGDGPLNGTGAAAGWYVEEVTTPPNAIAGTRYLALWSGRPGMNNAARYVLFARPDLGNYFRPQSGAKYELKVNAENAANQTVSIGIQWLDVSQAYITQEIITFNIGEVGQKSLQITAPSNASFGRVIVFNQGGSTLSGYFRVANIVVRDTVGATMVVDGAITTDKLNAGAVTAAKINVTQLSAISATIGTLRTATTGARTEINDNLIEVYDSSNVLRVRIGVW